MSQKCVGLHARGPTACMHAFSRSVAGRADFHCSPQHAMHAQSAASQVAFRYSSAHPWLSSASRASAQGRMPTACKAYSDEVWDKPLVEYFAFGANLNSETLKRRQLRPFKSRPGKLKDYRLAFNVPGMPFIEPSFASVEISPGAEVHGRLMALTRSDWLRLAWSEGVNTTYAIEDVVIETYEGEFIHAVTLRGIPNMLTHPRDVPPSPRYLNLIREGAREIGLDMAYQEKLGKLVPAITFASFMGR